MSEFFLNTLPTNTASIVDVIQNKSTNISFLKNFYLSGGTGLSLQIGHRESEDLDFFTEDPFQPEKLQLELEKMGQLSQTELATGTLNTFLDGVKLQFLEYPYPLIEQKVQWNNIQLSSVADIACTKLQTIGMRGSKKDFIDIYFLLEKYTLSELFSLVNKKYSKADYSQTHILKSLVYFIDAEEQPMPRMIKHVSWEKVKQKMIDVTKSFEF